MGDHFAVGRRAKAVAFALQAGLERAEVFDDAVVDDRHDAVAADVRMGVDVGGRAVRGPAGVADADVARRADVRPVRRTRLSSRPARLGDLQLPWSIVATPALS